MNGIVWIKNLMDKPSLKKISSKEDLERSISFLLDFAEKASDEEYESFIESIYDRDAEIRELTVELDDRFLDYNVYHEGRPVGFIDNLFTGMLFYSFESPFGEDFPLVVEAPKRSLDQSPEDEVSIAMFECFDRYVRSGEPFRTRYGFFWEPCSGFIPYLENCRRILDSVDGD